MHRLVLIHVRHHQSMMTSQRAFPKKVSFNSFLFDFYPFLWIFNQRKITFNSRCLFAGSVNVLLTTNSAFHLPHVVLKSIVFPSHIMQCLRSDFQMSSRVALIYACKLLTRSETDAHFIWWSHVVIKRLSVRANKLP